MPRQVTLGIGPEQTTVATGVADITFTPTMIENTGAQSYIAFTLNRAKMTAKVPGRMNEESTDVVGFAVSRQACFV